MTNLDKIVLQNKQDKKISIALMASFVILTIQFFVIIYFNLSGSNTNVLIQFSSKILVGLAFLYALPVVIKRSLNTFFVIYFFSSFIFIIHYTFFPENRMFLNELIFPFFFMCLPAFIYSLSIRNFNILKKIMKLSSYLVFSFGSLLAISIFLGQKTLGTYSMALSYYILLPALLFLEDFFDNFSLKYFILSIFSLFIILALGSRGPILCVIAFSFFKILNPYLKKTKKRFFIQISLIFTGLSVFVFLEEIIMYIYIFLLKFNLNSRTIFLFFNEGIYLSGREKIYENVVIKIFENPLFGLGIAGDRRIAEGVYSHNFFIEIIANFGIIIGTFLCFSLLFIIFKTLASRNNENYNFIVLWISLGFVHLMVSGSYLIDLKFWIFLGITVNILKYKKNKVKDEKND